MADGGPHQLAINNGTQGLSGDCAACHRAHTAQAESMLKQAMPGLCINCHNGTGATADVVDGYQYVPDGSGNPTATVLGALRGGGFSYTLIDSANAVRQSIGGTWLVTFTGAPTGGTFRLTFNGTSTGDITYDPTDAVYTGTRYGTFVSAAPVAVNIENALVALAGTDSVGYSTALSSSQKPKNASNVATTDNVTVAQAKDSTTGAPIHDQFVITAQFTLRLSNPTIGAGTSALTGGTTPSLTVDVTTQSAVRQMAAIPALAASAKVATTSTHSINGATGTVWGNGASGTVGSTGVVLNCAQCHNPHGNGQYRILQTTPGEDWATATGVADWTAPTYEVEVKDVPTASTKFSTAVVATGTSVSVASATGFPSSGSFTIFVDAEQMIVTGGQGTTTWTVTRGANGTTAAAHTTAATVYTNALVTGQVRNYTVKAGTLTSDVSAGGTGDFWRYKYDPSGTNNWTNFYLSKDDMNTGWDGVKAVNAATNGNVPPPNSNGLMTAWCVQCHTRYSTAPQFTNGAGANADTGDPTFKVRHSTSSSVGCEQCHVSHGTSAAMTAQFSSAVKFPDGSLEDSALLKLPNRGTCNMCHDPTKTVTPGTAVGATSTIPLTLTAKY